MLDMAGYRTNPRILRSWRWRCSGVKDHDGLGRRQSREALINVMATERNRTIEM